MLSIINDIFNVILNFLHITDLKNLYFTNKYLSSFIKKYIKYNKLKCRICNIINYYNDTIKCNNNIYKQCIKCTEIICNKCHICDKFLSKDFYLKPSYDDIEFDSWLNMLVCTSCVEKKIYSCNICNNSISNYYTCYNEKNSDDVICFKCVSEIYISYTDFSLYSYTFIVNNKKYMMKLKTRPFYLAHLSYDGYKPILYKSLYFCNNFIYFKGFEIIILCVQLGYITLEEFYSLKNVVNYNYYT